MTNARQITAQLRGKWFGAYGRAVCPVCGGKSTNPRLSIKAGTTGKILLKCFGGCEFSELLRALNMPNTGNHVSRMSRADLKEISDADAARKADMARKAKQIWSQTVPLAGTDSERYLASRGITLPAELIENLRHHPNLYHPSVKANLPGMVALVTGGEGFAIHRTFFDAAATPRKMMLGPVKGGAVHLAEPTNQLMVGEGIETCLSVMQATGHPAWAALSTSGLKALTLPASVTEVTVLADGDDAGEAAARECALRWQRENRIVRIARPPRGQDFNDVLLASLANASKDKN